MNPDQTAPLGPYSLQYSLPKNLSTTKSVTGGGKWVKV